ncbi:N-acetyltransferase [Desulfovibrio sp. OttesenSCG-928-A18]|nr:N-acetyltransferase [Desulfovibrio sp. OttesenSCG-928-A18]
MEYSLHTARVSDVKEIHSLLLGAADKGQLLARSLSDLYSHARDFVLMKNSRGEVAGCCALAIIWEDLAEIRSLYVREELRLAGLGRAMVENCLRTAGDMGLARVFTLTYKTAFFERLGFAEVGKEVLPQKIWADCIHCPKFPDCDEVAMQREV